MTTVEAIYEDGMLRPLQPLSLPEHTHVRLSIETLPDDPVKLIGRFILKI